MTLAFDSIELELDNRKVLSSVAMACSVGEVVGLLGRNGSGKSCLLKVVFGAMPASYRSVRINGQPLLKADVPHQRIHYLPQEGLIPPYVTIGEALSYFRVSKSAIISRLPVASDWLNFTPSQCSGGALRLLETIVVLLGQASFCLLDEPFTGLMPLHIETLKMVIAEQKKKKGIIITDHLHQHVTGLSDRVYVLTNGTTYPIKDPLQLVRYGYLKEESSIMIKP